MKKIISLFLVYSITLQASAQEFNVALSEPQGDRRSSENHALPGGGFIGMTYTEDNGGAANWIKRRAKISILLFDADMKLVKENKMANGERAFSVVYIAFKKTGDKFWLIYVEPGDKNNFGDFKVVEINPVTLEATKPKTIVAPGEIRLRPDLFNLKVDFKTSPNGKLAYFFVSTTKKEAYLCAIDEEFNTRWSQNDIATDIGIDPKNINSIEVDNKGIVYLGFTKEGFGHVAVFRDGKTPQILDITMKTGKPNEVLVLAHKNKSSITIAGGYFENTVNVHGVFKADIDDAFKIGEIIKTPFSESIVKQFDGDSWGSTKPNKYGIEPYYLAQLFEIDDNIVDLVIEIKRIISHQNIGNVVHSGNILNAYLINGSASFTRIPKYNVAVASDWSHYYAIPFGKKMVIFYNDNSSNLKKDINVSPKLVNIEDNSVLVAAVIEPDGSVQRRLPLKIEQDYMGIAEWIKPVATDRWQVPLYFKKKLGYATISIK